MGVPRASVSMFLETSYGHLCRVPEPSVVTYIGNTSPGPGGQEGHKTVSGHRPGPGGGSRAVLFPEALILTQPCAVLS